MDIWTERLERRHLPLLAGWLERSDGAMTPNDLPAADALGVWYDSCSTQQGRVDFLVRVYDTPVGAAGLRPKNGQPGTAELWLLLGEMSYNPLRTATYAAIRVLDRAFQDLGLTRVTARVLVQNAAFLEALERMGFSCAEERDGLRILSVEKSVFSQHKYLF